MFDDLRYTLRQNLAWLAGKSTVKLATTGVTQLGGPIGVASGVFGAGLTVFLAQFNFKQEKEQLLNFYRPELAAYTHKNASDVTFSDLRDVAKGKHGVEENHAIKESYEHAAKKRWLKIGVGIAAGVATLAIVAYAAPALLLAAGVAGGTVLAATTIMGATLALKAGVAAAVGLGAVVGFTLGTAAGHVAEKVTGLDQPTPHAHVAQIAKTLKGKGSVSQEQVMGAVVASHPKLAAEIRKTHQAPFHELPLAQKQIVVAEYGPRFAVAQVTDDLNHRQIRPGEIPFAVCGQKSGIPRLSQPPASFRQRAQEVAGHAYQKGRENLNHAWEKGHAALAPWVEQGRETLTAGLDQAQEKIGQGYAKLVETGEKYLSSFRNANVEGAMLSPEKSAETLPSLESVKGKWQSMLERRVAAAPAQTAGALR